MFFYIKSYNVKTTLSISESHIYAIKNVISDMRVGDELEAFILPSEAKEIHSFMVQKCKNMSFEFDITQKQKMSLTEIVPFKIKALDNY